LGFKQAHAAPQKQLPGVLDYFGYDEAADQLIHVHAHYQLVLGHDRTKNYRLPIETAFLSSAAKGYLFDVPTVEFEFVVFVIRMMLKHSTWDVMLGGEIQLGKNERAELVHLQDRIDPDRVRDILEHHLPYIHQDLFSDCLQALQPGCPFWVGIGTGRRLQATLQANARRPRLPDTFLKLGRRGALGIRRRILKKAAPFKYRLEGGGAMIAIVGGDGAGKTTAIGSLQAWLSRHFDTTCVHLGKPAWSWTTIGIRATLKIGNVLGLYPVDSSFRQTLEQKSLVSPGYPWLFREICRSRDRYRTYVTARRSAAKGRLVILDRFPLSEIKLMDGPQIERFVDELAARPQGSLFMSPRKTSALVRFLMRREARYYERTARPDLLIALPLDPEVAVKRKTDEPAESVRERSTEVWKLDWGRTEAHVVDAGKSKSEVLAEIKSLVWSSL